MSLFGIFVASGGFAWNTNLYAPLETGPTKTVSKIWSCWSLSAEPTYVSFHSKSSWRFVRHSYWISNCNGFWKYCGLSCYYYYCYERKNVRILYTCQFMCNREKETGCLLFRLIWISLSFLSVKVVAVSLRCDDESFVYWIV